MSASSETDAVVICRTCISECNDYKSLYKQGIILGEVTTLATLLSYCTNLEYSSEEDCMPANICTTCVGRLAKSYMFKKTVLDTNELLRRAHLLCTEDTEPEHSEIMNVEHTYVSEEVDAEELQELANAAQIKQEVENVEYVTLTVVEETVEEDRLMETEEIKEQCWSVHEENVGEFFSEEEVGQEEQQDGAGEEEDEDEDEEIEVDAVVGEQFETHVVEEIVEGYNEVNENQVQVKEELYEILSVDDKFKGELIDESDTTSKLKKARGLRVETDSQSQNKHSAKKCFKSRNTSAHAKSSDPELQCAICGKQLSNQNSLKYHLQLHSDITPYLCSLCGEGFKTRNAYEGHIILHDPNNPNTCHLCGKMYRQSSSLRTHMLSHTGEKPYQCDICGKGMTQKSGYKKHMLIHSGEKPHTCDICGRHFRYSSNLIAHRRCHSNEKPYTCPQCDKCFHTMEQRKRHLLVHTVVKAYPCESCGKKFKRRSSLTAHRNTHSHQKGRPELIEQKLSKSNVVELY